MVVNFLRERDTFRIKIMEIVENLVDKITTITTTTNREVDSFAMGCRSYSARSLTRPLCATTGVMVQTVQFLDKVVAMPVVFTTGAHGSRRA